MTSFKSEQIPYSQTAAFSAIVTGYLAGSPDLKPFYAHSPDIEGIKNAIALRRNFATNRGLLVSYLKTQYANLDATERVQFNIESLLQENTFTITTAHQPNIFTGHLYFIYKILHAVKLAEELSEQIPGCNFVPVYYMGSEDADLEELGQVTINGKKYSWQTDQHGAVGRMVIDKAFIALTDAIDAQVSVEPYGAEMMAMVRRAYSIGKTIEQATFEFVHGLFKNYGLIILLPDNAVLKQAFSPIIRKEITEEFSHKAVAATMNSFPAEYKVQAAGREINLFYLKGDSRERIEKINGGWKVMNSTTEFDDVQILNELHEHPERFSPNVILRPVLQELILPDVAFIGGGGEIAYWLELKKVFEAAGVPYPVLVLRNSFLFAGKKNSEKIDALRLNLADFFKPTHDLTLQLVKQSSGRQLNLTAEKAQLAALYDKIKQAAGAVDVTLQQHTDALFTKANSKLKQLEKKILLAEKKKFEAEERQIEKLKEELFPTGNLQERVDNFIPYYCRYGKSFMEMLYKCSKGLDQQFCLITEKG
jgi:bacillithiol synthase